MYQNSIYSKIKSLKWNLRGILRSKLLLVFRLLKVHKWCFHCFHFMHVFQSYIETILKSTNPLKFITENCINFHLFILSKIKPSASCLNKKYASQALCILQYIFKLENVSMRIKDQVTMTLIHVYWIKWTTLFNACPFDI